jgi:hypothetical protein
VALAAPQVAAAAPQVALAAPQEAPLASQPLEAHDPRLLQAKMRSSKDRPPQPQELLEEQSALAAPQLAAFAAPQVAAPLAAQPLSLQPWPQRLPNNGWRQPQAEPLESQPAALATPHVAAFAAPQVAAALAAQPLSAQPLLQPLLQRLSRPQPHEPLAEQSLDFPALQPQRVRAGLSQQPVPLEVQPALASHPHPTPSIRSSNSKPKLWALIIEASTIELSIMFHFIEPCLLYDGT